MTQNVRSQMARGAAWMLLFKLVDRGIGLVSTLVLVRLLDPANFGIVTMAMSFIALLELIGAFGFDMALIQRADASPAHYNTAWTFNVLFGIAMAALMVALAVPAGAFYKNDSLAEVVRVLALGSMLQGFQNIGVVAFRKDLEFHKEFKFLLTKRLVTFPVTIALALLLRNHWALVVGIVSGRLLDVLISYRVHPYRPSVTLSAAQDLLHFSKWILLLNLFNFMKERSSDFVIGRMLGARSLGLFSVTYEFSNLPSTELVAPINRAVYPAYAKIALDKHALAREYLSVMGMISLIAIPAVAGLAATAKLVVPVAFGLNYLEAIPILQILAFFGVTQVMQSNAYALFLATGRANVCTAIQGLHVALLLTLLVAFTKWWGLKGTALSFITVAAITMPITLAVILRTLGLPARRFGSNVWRPLVAAGGMFLVVAWSIREVSSTAPMSQLLPKLLLSIVLGAALYVALIAVTWWISGRPEGAETVILGRVRPVLARARQIITRN
jgi:O-antigen/teichoic acid export membrane protein